MTLNITPIDYSPITEKEAKDFIVNYEKNYKKYVNTGYFIANNYLTESEKSQIQSLFSSIFEETLSICRKSRVQVLNAPSYVNAGLVLKHGLKSLINADHMAFERASYENELQSIEILSKTARHIASNISNLKNAEKSFTLKTNNAANDLAEVLSSHTESSREI